jgi:predicted ArsR family transcriptional regulator
VARIVDRFLETTRGRVLLLLRQGPRTVEQLAQALELTDNAVRSHLLALERDGLIRTTGVRRGTGAGKPASLYELSPSAQPLFSKAYTPTLNALLGVLAEQLPRAKVAGVLAEVGRRLAADAGGPAGGTLEERVRAGAALLNALGGLAEVDRWNGSFRIQGYTCPLSATVSVQPQACRAIETMLSRVIGKTARQCCQHGERPRCCFEIVS